MLFTEGKADAAAFQLFQTVGVVFIFGDVMGDDDLIIVADGNKASVKSPVEIGAESNAVADGIFIGNTERFNMAGINKTMGEG